MVHDHSACPPQPGNISEFRPWTESRPTYLPKVPIAAQVECSIGRGGSTENGLLERAAIDEQAAVFGGPHDVNGAVVAYAEEQAAREHKRRAEVALEPKLTEHVARL